MSAEQVEAVVNGVGEVFNEYTQQKKWNPDPNERNFVLRFAIWLFTVRESKTLSADLRTFGCEYDQAHAYVSDKTSAQIAGLHRRAEKVYKMCLPEEDVEETKAPRHKNPSWWGYKNIVQRTPSTIFTLGDGATDPISYEDPTGTQYFGKHYAGEV